MITLYGMSSPNVRKVLIAFEEMGIAYHAHHVSVFRGAQFAPEVLALNPLAKVPILVDPDGPAQGEPIFESGAILVYLAEAYGPEFLPASGPERYVVLKWLFMQTASMGPALGNHSHFRSLAKGNGYAASRFRRMAAQAYRALDRRLADAPYLGGERYSIADMAAWPWSRYFHRHGMRDDDCPHLMAWIERPAVCRTNAQIAAYAAHDAADQQAASPEEFAMFLGQHLPAPSAEAAAEGLPTTARHKPIPEASA